MDEPATHTSLQGAVTKSVMTHLIIPGALLVLATWQEAGTAFMYCLEKYDGLRERLRGDND